MTATEILKKHGKKATKTIRAKTAVEQAVKDRAKAKRMPGVDPAGAGAQVKTVANDKAAQEKTSGFIASLHPIKPGSRSDLMAKAKERGIKYFRIMTKGELFQVLDHPGDIVSITEKAKARWKTGWGAKGEAVL